MEIIIRLAGVQLGPYSEDQVRQHMAEGLLSATDLAQRVGSSEEWKPLGNLMAKSLAPEGGVPLADTDQIPEMPKRAPYAPPAVTAVPAKNPEPPVKSPEPDGEAPPTPMPAGQDKKTMLLGPTAPSSLTSVPPNTFSTATTSPLVGSSQGTKKVARTSLSKAQVHKTSPLPTKPILLPSRQPPSSVPTGPMIPAIPDNIAPPPPPAPSPTPPAKRAAPPLEEKDLSAKTVPMRSAAPPLPPRSTMPVTTPLPTKQNFRPKSGAVPPPPSVVSALTKKLGKVTPPLPPTPEDDLLNEVKTELIPPPIFKKEAAKPAAKTTTEPATKTEPKTDDKAAKKTGDKTAEKPVTPTSPESNGRNSKPKPRRILPLLICACAGLALVALYYIWSPYHASASLRSALNNGDAADLTAAVDFASVRDSLKEQIHAQLAQSGVNDADAIAMIDRSVDLYVTPEGISALVKTPDSVAQGDQGPVVSPDVAANILLAVNAEPVKNQGLATVTDFVLDRDVALFHLVFQGLGWKLKRIDIQPDLHLQSPSDTAVPLLSPVVDTYLEQGTDALKKNDWKNAIAAFTQVLALAPQSSVAYNDRGTALQAKNDLDGAIKDFTQALTIDPTMAAAYNSRGNAKYAKNDLDGASADLTQAIHYDPNLASAYDCRGNVKAAKGDLDGAIADFSQAIGIDPNLASAYSDRGFARQANGNLDGAITDYTQALALKPKTAMVYYNRGLARQSQGNFDAAIVDFDHALAFDPTLSGAFFSRGNAKNANHDPDGAIADYTQAVTLNPKYAMAFNNRGQARQAKNDLDGAAADYTQALNLDPKIGSAYLNRGVIEGQKNDLDNAIADSTQALYLDPKNAPAYNTRGFAKLAKGNLDGALADLKQFCDLSPRDHDADHARLYLWLIAKAQNTKADADQELSDALENSWNSTPDDLVSKTAAFLLGRMNEADYLAAAPSSDAKIDQAQRCESWYFAGMKRLLMGDKKGAIDAFNQCVATEQTNFCEYVLAKAELQGLVPPALPTAVPVAMPVVAPAKSP